MARPSCIILSRQPHEEPARWVQQCLATCTDLDVRDGIAGALSVTDGGGLVVMAAHSMQLELDIALLIAIRSQTPGLPVLVVGAGLDRAQISRVLAHGAY